MTGATDIIKRVKKLEWNWTDHVVGTKYGHWTKKFVKKGPRWKNASKNNHLRPRLTIWRELLITGSRQLRRECNGMLERKSMSNSGPKCCLMIGDDYNDDILFSLKVFRRFLFLKILYFENPFIALPLTRSTSDANTMNMINDQWINNSM